VLADVLGRLPAARGAAAARAQAGDRRAGALVVYADRVADPGNMGTLVRAAAAFGAAALAASPGSVDLFGPKTVRAGMGAVFGLPLYPELALDELVARTGITDVYGLVAHDGDDLAAAELGGRRCSASAPSAPGSRPRRSPPSRTASRSRWRRRPPAAVESLNAGVAGAVALYEFAVRRSRTRRRPAGSPAHPNRPAGPPPAHPTPTTSAGARRLGRERMTMDDEQLQILKERAPALAALFTTGRESIIGAADLAELERVRVATLGRKSPLTEVLRSIATAAPEERPLLGKGGNMVRRELEALVEQREAELKRAALTASLASERLDVTLPGAPFPAGHEHLISQTMREVEDIFTGLGYRIAEGPEVELDYYNFTALNTPPSHPARSAHDTFWVQEQREPMPEAVIDADRGVLLRTHTSPVQVRVMEQQRPPVYVLCLGKVYRRDSDATHTPMFHQVEGLVVDEGITLADLKGTVHHFTRSSSAASAAIRVRPHFFPFTEPSIEVDVTASSAPGKGCRSCKHSGWLEIMGAGMVDPNVYGFVDYDPEQVSGFAFGMGVERMAMLKHGIPDLRLFYDNDVRFLRQF
jgi:phenylalanyl-tRNA synthetase alpha chain